VCVYIGVQTGARAAAVSGACATSAGADPVRHGR
jgi:hypothetical protein